MASLFLLFFFTRPTSAVNYLHEREGGRRVKALRSYLSGYPFVTFTIALRIHEHGRVISDTSQETNPTPPPPRVPAAVLHRPSPRNFQSSPPSHALPSPPSGGVEFHGIPLILGEINIDTVVSLRDGGVIISWFIFILFFLLFYSYQTGAVLIFIFG